MSDLDPRDRRRARFLIPDTMPLSLLGLIGPDALDWLFVPGAEVWITDMVEQEATRDPDPGADPRRQHRTTIAAWFAANRHRISIRTTGVGEDYREAMETWGLAGRPPRLKPKWRDRGERSVFEVLDAAERTVRGGEAVVVLTDDANARAALLARTGLDIDLMGTESFIAWMAGTFGVAGADTAWQTIVAATGGTAPITGDDDPVYVRRPG